MGDLTRARADHAQLLQVDQELATKLERLITGAGERDDSDGLAAQYD